MVGSPSSEEAEASRAWLSWQGEQEQTCSVRVGAVAPA